MSINDMLGWLWDSTTRFDYVDRMIVTIFLFLNAIVMVFLLAEHLTASEISEVAWIFDALPFLLIFFFVWPLLYVSLVGVIESIVGYWNNRGAET